MTLASVGGGGESNVPACGGCDNTQIYSFAINQSHTRIFHVLIIIIKLTTDFNNFLLIIK